MHNLEKYLPPTSMKGDRYEAANWKFCEQEFTISDICVAIKGGLPSSMHNELEDNQEDYLSLTHEYWCNLLSTIEVKDNRKRAATHIKKIYYSRVTSLSDSNRSVRTPMKKNAILVFGVLLSNKGPHKKAPKNQGTQCHCVICKK